SGTRSTPPGPRGPRAAPTSGPRSGPPGWPPRSARRPSTGRARLRGSRSRTTACSAGSPRPSAPSSGRWPSGAAAAARGAAAGRSGACRGAAGGRWWAGVAGGKYRTELEATGGDGDLTWSEYGGGRVLDDLELFFDATGALVGTPPLSLLQGESEKEFAITMRVRDAANRIGVGVVTLTVKAPGQKAATAKEEEGGCQTGSGDASFWTLALLGLALLRRRR